MREEIFPRLSTLPWMAVCALGQPGLPWEPGLPVAMTCEAAISVLDLWEKPEMAAQQTGQLMPEFDRLGTMAGYSRIYSTMASHVVARRCVECFGL